MNINLTPFVMLWSAIALAVLVLLVWRRIVASREDDQLHVLHGAVNQQAVVANRLDVIDRWGKALTVVALALGLAIAAVYVYTSYVSRGA